MSCIGKHLHAPDEQVFCLAPPSQRALLGMDVEYGAGRSEQSVGWTK